MSETNDIIGAVIILLLNAFEQSAILTVSYVICKASIYVMNQDLIGSDVVLICIKSMSCILKLNMLSVKKIHP